jgi:arylsulfatase A-like enzyme
MTGYSYDTRVPLLLFGGRFKPGVYTEQAKIVDIAPTLSFVLGVMPPTSVEGRVLGEALMP